MTLTTISKCSCRLHLYRLFYLREYVRCAFFTWPTDAYNLNVFFCSLIACSSLCEILPEFTRATFILYDIKYIYGHIVPINFISLNPFSAITAITTSHNIHTRLAGEHTFYHMERTRFYWRTKKNYLTLSDNYVNVIPTREQSKRKTGRKVAINLKKKEICIKRVSHCWWV